MVAPAAAFARHFFGGPEADSEVTDYVAGALADLWEEGLPAEEEEAGAQVEGFLPPGADPAPMLAALPELWEALAGRQPWPAGEPPAWLQEPPAPDTATSAPAEAAAAEALEAAAAAGTRQAGGEFNARAAAFVMPKPGAASDQAEEGLAGLSLGGEAWEDPGGVWEEPGGGGPGAGAAWAWEGGAGCGDDSGDWEDPSGFDDMGEQATGRQPYEPSDGGGYHQCTAASHSRRAAAALSSSAPLDDPRQAAAFLAVLEQQFPLYSSAALAQLFEGQGRSPAGAIDALYALEAEVEGQFRSRPAPPAAPAAPAAPSFGAGDFPTLRGGGGGGGGGTVQRSLTTTGSYAGRAAAAAALPQQRTPAAAVGSSSSRAGVTRAAPVWQQSEGVQRFATGVAVAAEYAEQRSTARDHARLRNAYFEQVREAAAGEEEGLLPGPGASLPPAWRPARDGAARLRGHRADWSAIRIPSNPLLCCLQATAAYLAGSGAAAKELGARGRWHGAQMHAAHAAAAEEIFSRRNAAVPGGGTAAAGGVPTLDLHGLHVSEALARVEAALRQRGRRVRLVVGVGQHGNVPARLPRAVRALLQERGVPFSELYAGLLEVTPP